jgi:CHAT domain-containing protein
MNDLPAAAVAVMTAYNETYQSDRHAVAAALRAAAGWLYDSPSTDYLWDIATEVEKL